MARLKAPDSGVTVRMYRQGHGDCFLLAFRGDDGSPTYMLIDCGLFPGSTVEPIDEIIENIEEATGGHLHVVAITHEHMDHVSGFTTGKEIFRRMTIDECWLGWTEDPDHDLANDLRTKYHDTLLGLVAAANQLHGARGADGAVGERLEELLGFEIESDNVLGVTIKGIKNKRAMKVVKDKAGRIRYLRPHRRVRRLPNVTGLRVFVLGPPENEAALQDMDPRSDEEFHIASAAAQDRALLAGAMDRAAGRFRRAARDDIERTRPFDDAARLTESRAFRGATGDFFEEHYGSDEDHPAAWRQIDNDWLRGADRIALRMNNMVNNTSLVLAFELPRSGRVLLFVGDAQRGNWASWHRKRWTPSDGLDPGETIEASDLLARTVLYKVGHHGSHNATLSKGGLDEMAQDDFASEFVAMIPANRKWAFTKSHPWKHPLKAIHKALKRKARGRVFMTSTRRLRKPSALSTAEWKEFTTASDQTRLYVDYTVSDDD